MPPSYDVGALLDELARLRLFVVEIRDFDAMLVPAVQSDQRPKNRAYPSSVRGDPRHQIDDPIGRMAQVRS
jgi:hypothetical protein